MSFLQKIKTVSRNNDIAEEKMLEDKHKSLTFASDKETRTERFEICKSCEHLFKLTNTCKKCGCFMKAKTWLASAKCPINKW